MIQGVRLERNLHKTPEGKKEERIKKRVANCFCSLSTQPEQGCECALLRTASAAAAAGEGSEGRGAGQDVSGCREARDEQEQESKESTGAA